MTFKITTDGINHNLKNTKKLLTVITTQKTSENEALNLYDELIKPDILLLEKAKGRGKKKRENILNVLSNLQSVFTGVYLHYDNAFKSESRSNSEFEGSVAEKTKLRKKKKKSDDKQIKIFIDLLFQTKKEQKNIYMSLFSKYFTYKKLDQMVQALYDSKRNGENDSIVSSAMNNFKHLENKVKEMPKFASKEQI